MRIRNLAALLTVALCIGVFGTASAERVPQLITKRVQWGTWGPSGLSGSAQDTSQTAYDGANDVDTTAAIYVGDMAWDILQPRGGAASVIQGALKVWITSNGSVDDIDSLYYAVEKSPDGIHWNRQTGLIAAGSVAWKGVLAGQDQGGSVVDIAGNCLSFTVIYDADDPDGTKATQVAELGNWYLAPWIRLHILTDDTSTNVLHAPEIKVSYMGYRE